MFEQRPMFHVKQLPAIGRLAGRTPTILRRHEGGKHHRCHLPPCGSGTGTVRTSGTDAFEIAEKLFRSLWGTDLRKATHEHSRLNCSSGWAKINEVLVSAIKGPAPHATDDTIEISCHKGRIPLWEAFRALAEAGAPPLNQENLRKVPFDRLPR